MRRLSLAFVSLAVAVPVLAQQTPAAPAAVAAPVKGASVEGITEYTLANGLRVLLFPDASKPTTTVNITYLVGSRLEGYGETGMAHLLEHMVFKGTPKHPNVPQELSEHGASPNGSTWYDRTNYFETFLATDANLRWALDLESDRMVHSYIAKKDLESEMTVVRNEYESGENDPSRILLERVMSTAYLWHNYGKSTIGARSDIENVPIERLQGFYHKYYQPDNAVLVVAGKFTPATTLQLIQQTFGAIPRPRRVGDMKIWPSYTAEPTQDGERSVTLRRVGDVQAIAMAWHIPAGSHADFAAIDVLAEVLSSQPNGRLYQAVVATKKASSVSAFDFQLKEPGVLIAQAEVKKEDNAQVARDAMLAAIDSLLTKAPATTEEVERGKASLLSNVALELANSEEVGLDMSEWSAMGDWRLLFVHRDQIKKVTADDVMRVAKEYLKADNRTVGMFVPDATPNRAEIPPVPNVVAVVSGYRGDTTLMAGEAFDATPANIEARTKKGQLPGGIKYAFLPKKTRGGTVHLNLTLDFGSEKALMNKGAAPTLLGGMLMRGTEQRTRQQMTDTLNRLQADVQVNGSAESATVAITATRAHLTDAINLAVEMLRHPRFDAKEFDILKQENITGLESQRSDPQSQAVLAFLRHLSPLPNGHPDYVGTIDEQEGNLKAGTLDDAKAFYHAFYGASNGEVAVVGDFDPDSVRSVLAQDLGNWRSPVPFSRVRTPTGKSTPLNIVLKTPDKANSMFVAGRTLPLNDESADYPALVLANYMLGGGFLSSRLATRIRQKDGLSYGIGTQFQAESIDSSSVFLTYAIYAPENRDHVEKDFNEEMLRAGKDGFTADEIAKAKQGLLGDRARGRADDGAVASRLTSDLFLGRSFTKAAQVDAQLSALTAAQLQAVVAKYLDPAAMAVVKAGDFDKKAPTVIKP